MTQETRRLGEAYALEAFPALIATPFGIGKVRAARLRIVARPDAAQDLDLAPEPAYFVMLYLDPVIHCDLLAMDVALPQRQYQRGSVCIVDLSNGARIRLSSSLNAVGFVVPFCVLKEARMGRRNIIPPQLRLRRNEQDAIIYRLGLSILPCFDSDPPVSIPSLPHVIGALCAHLVEQPGPSLH